jgi:hypothetical protein
MAQMKHSAAVVIGDVIASRRAPDRTLLHERLTEVLHEVNALFAGDLRLTVGDEFQGAFPDPGAALRATLAIRVRLLPDYDVRHGVGVGEVQQLDARDRIEDGPGWWTARSAIDAAREAERRPPTRTLRTVYRRADGAPGPDPAAVNAALLGRDALVGRLDARGVSVLRGLLDGRTQREIAEEQGVSTSAISQRVRHDGLGILLAVDELLGGVR